MKYRLKTDIGKYKKGNIVDVTFEEVKEKLIENSLIGVKSVSILWFVLDGKRYGTSLPTEENVKQKLIDRVFDEL